MRRSISLAAIFSSVVLFVPSVVAAAPAVGADWQTYGGFGYQSMTLSHGSQDTELPTDLSAGFNAHLGERFGRYFALEFGYSAGDATKSITVGTNSYLSKFSISGPSVDAMAFLPLWNSGMSLVGTAGGAILVGRSSDTNPAFFLPTTPPSPFRTDKNEFDLRAGGGLEWRPTQAVSVIALGRYQGANYGVAKSAVLLSLGLNFYLL
jgi:opacity protein-like surface antigen